MKSIAAGPPRRKNSDPHKLFLGDFGGVKKGGSQTCHFCQDDEEGGLSLRGVSRHDHPHGITEKGG